MSAPRASLSTLLRSPWLLLATLLLAACAGNQPRPAAGNTTQTTPANSTRKPWKPLGPYTSGGLYAPGVADGAPEVPPDIAKLPEPVPHPEPFSHYGNRSPYVVLGKSYTVLPSAAGYDERGMASWYGTKFDGRVTSSLEPYDLSQFSAAHRTLPLPSYARVTNLENGRSVIVRINDRGPFHEGRLIDLSYAAAIKLGVNVHGTAMVEVRGIDTRQMASMPPAEVAATKPAATHALLPAPPPAPLKKGPVPAPVPEPMAAATATGAAVEVVAPKPGADVATTVAAPISDAPVKSETLNPLPQDPATPPPPMPETITATASLPALQASTPEAQPMAATTTATPPATAAPQPATPLPATVLPLPANSAVASAAAVASTLPATVAPTPAANLAPTVVPIIPGIGHPAIDPSTPGFLQIASYGDRANAERMLQRLQQAGVEHAELVSVQVADQTLWRVHIGPMRADEAERVAEHLDDLGFGTPPFFKE